MKTYIKIIFSICWLSATVLIIYGLVKFEPYEYPPAWYIALLLSSALLPIIVYTIFQIVKKQHKNK